MQEVQRKGPHKDAIAEAVKAVAAAKPATRITFKAATKVNVPERPGAKLRLAALPPFGRQSRTTKDAAKEAEAKLDAEACFLYPFSAGCTCLQY